MRKGFLTQSKKDPTELGPLRDERSNRKVRGWGQCDTEGDPWVKRFQEVVVADQYGNAIQSTNHADENPYRNLPNLPYKTSGEPINALGCYYSRYYHVSHLKMAEYYFTWNDKNPKSHLLLWTAIFICPLSGELFMSGKWPGNDAVLKDATTSPIETGLLKQDHDDNNNTTLALDDLPLPIITDCTTEVDGKSTVPQNDSILVTPPSKHPNILQVRWMKKKKIAEHGAAAWAYDCFQHRHKQSAIAHRTIDPSSTVILPKIDIDVTSSIGSEIPYLNDKAMRSVPSYVPEIVRIQIEERMLSIRDDRMKFGENSMNDIEEELAWCSPDHAVRPHVQSETM